MTSGHSPGYTIAPSPVCTVGTPPLEDKSAFLHGISALEHAAASAGRTICTPPPLGAARAAACTIGTLWLGDADAVVSLGCTIDTPRVRAARDADAAISSRCTIDTPWIGAAAISPPGCTVGAPLLEASAANLRGISALRVRPRRPARIRSRRPLLATRPRGFSLF
ncbi:hypothetical protein ZWY2020_007228 [Hordeum vulgare]|nr:hypothetical protein ZWY2020_007228 [Hordeum vulgare]